MARHGQLNKKEAQEVSRGLLGWVANAFHVGQRLKAIGITYRASTAEYEASDFAIGTNSLPIPLATYAAHGGAIYTTNASTDGSNSVEAFLVKSVMTGIGGVGGRSKFHTYTNVVSGGWLNAIKGFMEFGATGRVTGLGSVVCGDLELSVFTTVASYTVFEANIIADVQVSTGQVTSFFRCNIAGSDSTGKTTINTNAYLFELGEGIADTTDGLFETEAISGVDATHVLRVMVAGTPYWMALHTAKGMA